MKTLILSGPRIVWGVWTEPAESPNWAEYVSDLTLWGLSCLQAGGFSTRTTEHLDNRDYRQSRALLSCYIMSNINLTVLCPGTVALFLSPGSSCLRSWSFILLAVLSPSAPLLYSNKTPHNKQNWKLLQKLQIKCHVIIGAEDCGWLQHSKCIRVTRI